MNPSSPAPPAEPAELSPYQAQWLAEFKRQNSLLERSAAALEGIETELGQEPLFDEPLVVMLPANHPLANRRTLQLQDLSRAVEALPKVIEKNSPILGNKSWASTSLE